MQKSSKYGRKRRAVYKKQKHDPRMSLIMRYWYIDAAVTNKLPIKKSNWERRRKRNYKAIIDDIIKRPWWAQV